MSDINISVCGAISIGGIISVLAMLAAVKQANLAKGSLKLSKKIYNDGKPKFEFNDILDSCIINNLDEDIVHAKFLVLITNYSDKSMVIKDLRLRLVGEAKEVILYPVFQDQMPFCGENIAAHSAINKWIQFDIKREIYKSTKIIKYTLVARDSFNNISEKSAICTREEILENV